MVEALGRCMICGGSVHAEKWVCTRCAAEHGLDAPYRTWPAWAKQLAADHQAERRAERLRLGIWEGDEEDADADLTLKPGAEDDSEQGAAILDMLAYGAFNGDAGLDDEPEESDGSQGGTLRCAKCGEEFADVWPTFPASPTRWQLPECPKCGGGIFEDVTY
jgi:DNA-directed RNA polymerase subunit RPC12/RpoP